MVSASAQRPFGARQRRPLTMTPLRGSAPRAHPSVSPPPQYACGERRGRASAAATSTGAAQHGRGVVKCVGTVAQSAAQRASATLDDRKVGLERGRPCPLPWTPDLQIQYLVLKQLFPLKRIPLTLLYIGYSAYPVEVAVFFHMRHFVFCASFATLGYCQ